MCVTFIHLQQVMAVAPYKITHEDVVDFKENSFVIKRNFFEDEVISLVSEVSRAEIKHREGHPEMWDSIPQEQHDLGDKTLFNAICYSERTVNAFQKLIREGCMEEPRWGRTRPDPLPTGLSFHHRKLIIKDEYNHTPEEALDNDHLDTEKPLGGGFRGGNRFLWHQDFLYWGDPDGKDAYDRPGRPFPDLVTCFIAIDPATRENGCLEVLRGSHRLGRLEFKKKPWGQRYTTRAGIQSALDAGCEPVFVELDPGDACFFHCEMLHQSAPNSTSDPRWAFLVCFDPMHNAPIGVDDWRKETPVWDDACLLEYGRRHLKAIG